VTAAELLADASPVTALHAADARDAVIKQADSAFGTTAVILP